MVGGQMIDIVPGRDEFDLDAITDLQALKTGALIAFSCAAGTILGRAGAPERAALLGYARDLGLAFQIVDDLLDFHATPEQLGKPTGQDAAAGKATFVGLLGPGAARARAEKLVAGACARLEIFSEKADFLRQTATFVLERRN
jgi:farnesyl diphosphate synthase